MLFTSFNVFALKSFIFFFFYQAEDGIRAADVTGVQSCALPIFFGVAFGNLFLGVPFHFDELQRPVYTAGFFNLLHPFALLAGIVSVAMLVMHGAAYAALKVGDPMSERAAGVGRAAAVVFVLAFV